MNVNGGSPSSTDYIDLDVDAVAALLVSDRNWEPHRSTVTVPYPDNQLALVEITNHIASQVPRWYWDGTRIEVLPPFPFEEDSQGFIDL